MKLIQLSPQTSDEIARLDELYCTTKDVCLQQRAQLGLLESERGLIARKIVKIVRLNQQSIRRWLKRYIAEGSEGFQDQPRPGATATVTREYC